MLALSVYNEEEHQNEGHVNNKWKTVQWYSYLKSCHYTETNLFYMSGLAPYQPAIGQHYRLALHEEQ